MKRTLVPESLKTLVVGEVANRIGIATWQVQALLSRGLIEPAGRVARYRFFTEDQIDQIRDAAERAGYLKAVEVV